LYINSPGGSVPGMLAIRDTMNFISCEVSTTAMGSAFSAGAFLLLSGAKGKRFALPNTRILLHQLAIQGGLGGQASDIEIHAKEMIHSKRRVNEIIAEETGQPFEKVERDTDRDFIMSPEEAIKYGVIDGIVSNSAVAKASENGKG
jgi:ATP-dependent Clp protease protease subunit